MLLLTATWFLPRQTVGVAGGDWRSRMPSVPKDMRRAFAVSSTAMVAAYTFGVLVLSLGGQVEHDLIGSPNAFLNSVVLSLFPVVMGATGMIARTLLPRTALIADALVSGLGMALAVSLRDLPIYLLATAAAGGAYILLFVGGLSARRRPSIAAAACSPPFISWVICRWVRSRWYWAPSLQRGGLVSLSISVRQ